MAVFVFEAMYNYTSTLRIILKEMAHIIEVTFVVFCNPHKCILIIGVYIGKGAETIRSYCLLIMLGCGSQGDEGRHYDVKGMAYHANGFVINVWTIDSLSFCKGKQRHPPINKTIK